MWNGIAGRRRVVDTNVGRDLLKGFGLVPKSPLGQLILLAVPADSIVSLMLVKIYREGD
jgi:hypothetical protein